MGIEVFPSLYVANFYSRANSVTDLSTFILQLWESKSFQLFMQQIFTACKFCNGSFNFHTCSYGNRSLSSKLLLL
jgi:hypothetical protein